MTQITLQWQQDLIRDIRFHDARDDLDENDGSIINCPNRTRQIVVRHPQTLHAQTMSECNISNLQQHFARVRDTARCILEIGVDCNLTPTEMTSTRTFLDNKLPSTVYVGVDLDDKSYLNNADKNTYTIQTSSSNIEQVWQFVESLGITQIDFLFIDGWHSINQCLIEWEYTRWLSPNGIVAWHDTASHPGPFLFTHNLDMRKWHVISNSCDLHDNDYGMGFAWRRI